MTREELLQIVKPILFNTEMVRAILDERKTATRRIAKGVYPYSEYGGFTTIIKGEFTGPLSEENIIKFKAPYKPSDFLYVRETWHKYTKRVGNGENCRLQEFYGYKASIANSEDAHEKWKPSIHMPKAAARIFLKVTDVRVERLQDITEEQAKLEGAIDNRGHIHSYDNEYDKIHSSREHFAIIWDSTIKKTDLDRCGWEANPWVWVIEFKRVFLEDRL